MRAKLMTILLSLIGLFVAALVFRVDQLLFSDKMNWNEAQARSQMGALAESMSSDLRGVRDLLELASPQITGTDYPKGKPLSRFHMIGMVSRSASGDLNLETRSFLEGSPTKPWAGNVIALALRTVNDANLTTGSTLVVTVQDPTRKNYFLLITRSGAQRMAALAGPEIFQSVMDRQKGQLSTVFIVNGLGQTVGHTTPEYVGTKQSEDPVVAALLKSEANSGSGTFESAQGSLQGFFERVPQSNLWVVVSTPVEALLGRRGEVRWQLILMGLGFVLVGAGLIAAVMKQGGGWAALFPREATATAGSSPAPVVTFVAPPIATAPPSTPAAPAPINPPATSQVRHEAYVVAASSLAHELRGPLLTLMGRTRLLREKLPAGESLQDLARIEENAREVNSTLQKLLTFAGEKEEQAVPTSLAEVLQRTLKMLDGKLNVKKVKVDLQVDEVPHIKGQPTLFVKAFEQIFENAIEAMERTLDKKLIVRVGLVGTNVTVLVEDSGEGIEPQNLERVMDPFFTTRTTQNHSGLGLSLAYGIIRGAGGMLKVESARGQGTRVIMEFPAESTTSVAAREVSSPTAPPTTPAPVAANGLPVPPPPVKAPPLKPPPNAAKSGSLPPPAPSSDLDDDRTAILSADAAEAGEEDRTVLLDLPEVLNDSLMEKTLDMIDELEDDGPRKTPPPPPPFRPQSSAAREPLPPLDPVVVLPPTLATEVSAAPPPPPPPPQAAPARDSDGAPSQSHQDFMQFTAKIDKPKPRPERKASRLDQIETHIRRPGERA